MNMILSASEKAFMPNVNSKSPDQSEHITLTSL